MPLKPKLSVYWASSCGGCEIAIVNLHENFLKLAEHFELVFCPCLMDTKIADVEAMPDASITLTLFNGAIRTEENDEMARLLRRKSKLLVAYGACSYQGGIPALSNFSSRDEHLRTIYGENASLDNLAQVSPQNCTKVPEGALELPVFFENVKTLAQCVKVDYFMPGCPPEPHQIWNVMEGIISGQPLPPPGSVIGAGTSSVCDECARERSIKVLPRFYRTYEVAPDPVKCLLEQGIVCMGIATRDGCGAPCPKANMPCTGCYGPPEGVRDQGAKMVAALGSILELGEYKGMTPEDLTQKVDELINSIPDPAGTYYKYGAAGSILGGKTQ
jgi:F420-non-reducing hydrogenase small subunit